MEKMEKKINTFCKPIPQIILWDELFLLNRRRKSKMLEVVNVGPWKRLRLLKMVKTHLS